MHCCLVASQVNPFRQMQRDNAGFQWRPPVQTLAVVDPGGAALAAEVMVRTTDTTASEANLLQDMMSLLQSAAGFARPLLNDNDQTLFHLRVIDRDQS
jgi:hypothetical protein